MFADRNRAGTYAIMLSLAAAMFGMFFFLTLFVQNVLGYSPLQAGLAFLPVTRRVIAVAAGARLAVPAKARPQALHGHRRAARRRRPRLADPDLGDQRRTSAACSARCSSSASAWA